MIAQAYYLDKGHWIHPHVRYIESDKARIEPQSETARAQLEGRWVWPLVIVCESVRIRIGDQEAVIVDDGVCCDDQILVPAEETSGEPVCQLSSFIDEHERYLAVAPLTHGTSTFLLPVLGSGGTLVLSSSTRPREVLDTLEHERITSVFMPPTLIYAILDDETVRHRDWSALRHFIYSAAPMRSDKILEAQAVFGTVETSYGQTEAPAIIAALSPADARDPDVLQSVGRAGLLTEIAIVDAQGRFLPAGQSGEIAVRGDLVMSGYWRQPDKTAEVLALLGTLGAVAADH